MKQDNVLVPQLLHEGYLADGRTRGALLRVEVYLLEGHQLAGLPVATLEHLHGISKALGNLPLCTYGSICSLSQLLQLLKGARVPSAVHGGKYRYDLAFAEVADADGRVGAVGHGESAGVRRLELARGWACRELGVPEDGRGGGELVGNAQSRAGDFGGGGGGDGG